MKIIKTLDPKHPKLILAGKIVLGGIIVVADCFLFGYIAFGVWSHMSMPIPFGFGLPLWIATFVVGFLIQLAIFIIILVSEYGKELAEARYGRL